MTPADIYTMYTQVLGIDLSDAGSKNATPTDAQKLFWLNRFKDILSKRIWQFDPAITLNLNYALPGTNGCGFDLRDTRNPTVTKPVNEVLQLVVNGNRMRSLDTGQYGLGTFTVFDARFPKWRTDSTGTPIHAAEWGAGKILIYPPPSSDVKAASTHYVAGQYIAKDLAATTVSSGATSATQTLASTSGIAAGDTLYFASAGVYAVVSSVTNATVLVLASSITTTTSESVYSVPDIPSEIWMALVWGAVMLSSQPNITEGQQLQRLALYDKNMPELIADIEYQNRKAFFGMQRPYVDDYLLT